MKALTIRQPWLWAILHAGKRIENRGRAERFCRMAARQGSMPRDRNDRLDLRRIEIWSKTGQSMFRAHADDRCESL